tara:strand:+ start:2447 stop:2599 length:153 start_codon:yes stop_codon:yes gene_type:complete
MYDRAEHQHSKPIELMSFIKASVTLLTQLYIRGRTNNITGQRQFIKGRVS